MPRNGGEDDVRIVGQWVKRRLTLDFGGWLGIMVEDRAFPSDVEESLDSHVCL